MESGIIFSDLQKSFRSALSACYPDDEINNILGLVAEHVLNYSKIDTFLRTGEAISSEKVERFRQVEARLQQWEPVQYVLGHTEFYGLTFRVDPRVLIPRPETEELVDWIVKSEAGRPSEVLDLGTGSGCIAVALAVHLPLARVTASDISPAALEVARMNAALNKADTSFELLDILNGEGALAKKYDIMVSNPPYVRESERVMMRRNVLDYEPPTALFVRDDDPLVYYRSLALL
jgi:release factor glutamine methyltransferase